MVRIEFSGPTKSGKTTAALKTAAMLTAAGSRVVLVNREDPRDRMVAEFREHGGNDLLLYFAPDEDERDLAAAEPEDGFDYILSERHLHAGSTLEHLFAPGQRIPELDDVDLGELAGLVLEELARRMGRPLAIADEQDFVTVAFPEAP